MKPYHSSHESREFHCERCTRTDVMCINAISHKPMSITCRRQTILVEDHWNDAKRKWEREIEGKKAATASAAHTIMAFRIDATAAAIASMPPTPSMPTPKASSSATEQRSPRFVRMESWQFRRNSTRKVAKKWRWRVPREELDKKTAKMLKQSNININNSIDTAHWNCIFTVLYPLSSVVKWIRYIRRTPRHTPYAFHKCRCRRRLLCPFPAALYTPHSSLYLLIVAVESNRCECLMELDKINTNMYAMHDCSRSIRCVPNASGNFSSSSSPSPPSSLLLLFPLFAVWFPRAEPTRAKIRFVFVHKTKRTLVGIGPIWRPTEKHCRCCNWEIFIIFFSVEFPPNFCGAFSFRQWYVSRK